MAIVRVDFTQGQPSNFSLVVSEVIHSAMKEIFGIPPLENFIICEGHEKDAILHAPETCSLARRDKLVFIQITLNKGRSSELKANFFSKLTQRLADTGLVAVNDVYVSLVEVARENWFFGSPEGGQ